MKLTMLTGFVAGISFRLLMLGLGPARMKLEVVPLLCSSPCEIRVLLKVTPEQDNRSFQVSIVGDNYESSSTQELAGAQAPYTQPYLWFHSVPAGEYEVAASLQTWQRTIAVERRHVEVK